MINVSKDREEIYNEKIKKNSDFITSNGMYTVSYTHLSLYQLNKPITYTIALPSNLKAEGKTFYVIRLHDGKADKLATTLNSDGTLSFSTDRFSTCLLYTSRCV